MSDREALAPDASMAADQTVSGDAGPAKSWSATTNADHPGIDEVADGNGSISSRLTSLVNDCLQQVQSSLEVLHPTISEIRGSSNEITELVHHSRQQAMLRKHQLEEERERVHQAVGKVLAVLNYDTTDVSCYSSILILGCGVLTVGSCCARCGRLLKFLSVLYPDLLSVRRYSTKRKFSGRPAELNE